MRLGRVVQPQWAAGQSGPSGRDRYGVALTFGAWTW
jgi:hypothetical protein